MTKGKWGTEQLGWPSHYFLEGDELSVCGSLTRAEVKAKETYDIPGIACPVCKRIFNYICVLDWLDDPQCLENFLKGIGSLGWGDAVIIADIIIGRLKTINQERN